MKHEEAVQNLAVEQYLLGDMNPSEREAFEEHYFECVICAEEVKSAVTFREDMKAILAADQDDLEAAAPTRVQPNPGKSSDKGTNTGGWNWLSWLQPQIAAVALAGLAVISIGSVALMQSRIAELSQPSIVNAAFLRDQTRGTPPVLRLTGGKPALLSFDLAVAPDSKLDFLVQSAGGDVVYQVSGDAPPQDEEVHLLLPKLDLSPGNYRVLVRSSGQEQDLAQYPFEIKGPN